MSLEGLFFAEAYFISTKIFLLLYIGTSKMKNKIFLIYISTLILSSCSNTNGKLANLASTYSSKKDSNEIALNTNVSDNTDAEDSLDENMATYYVVVADTGLSYYLLQHKMFDIHRKLHIPIDTMDRFYNKKKDLIACPDNYDDEIYAGEYYPRRDPSDHLSLEYLGVYQKNTRDKTIAIVTGIYETEREADSALIALKRVEPKVFKIKADLYIGCMH